MAERRSGLGRGLEALIPATSSPTGLQTIDLDRIEANPQQPRSHFDDETLETLAASIREVGLLQPVIVRALGDDRYELIAGERRCRAARMAGLLEVPAMVRDAERARVPASPKRSSRTCSARIWGRWRRRPLSGNSSTTSG